MLPHIATQQRASELLLERGAGVMGLHDVGAAVLLEHEPSPTGTEVAGKEVGEVLFEGGEGAELLLNLLADGSGGLAAAVRPHGVPVERVVPYLCGVVEYRTCLSNDEFCGFMTPSVSRV
ncbi:family 43 glycoside hydrolase, putative [Babesia ovata]|uniref:Family 43 glycoside hydrolase, putative n=1 Tax=Babesia ovata TaxID=189622 RepID=A0A2H6KB16_9APIC|nr:family 43 glycoside hydrolase, putative [Babesia ovata]GBE60176.1 family 43 glycoside hydrolase, putative [Babesia ovata]